MPAETRDKAQEDKNRADWITGLYAAAAECSNDLAWNRDYWTK